MDTFSTTASAVVVTLDPVESHRLGDIVETAKRAGASMVLSPNKDDKTYRAEIRLGGDHPIRHVIQQLALLAGLTEHCQPSTVLEELSRRL